MSNKIYCSPHLHSSETTGKIMFYVVISLLPATIGGIYFFGLYVLKVILVSIISCVFSEFLFQILLKKEIKILDGSAVVTGILFAFVLPPRIPLWLVMIGGFLAIFLVKELFGGLGFNIFNPALTARAILLASYPVEMTKFTKPFDYNIDAITSPTPLFIIKEKMNIQLPSLWQMFIGNRSGCIGETSVLLLLLGAIFLLYKKVITWHIPILYILTVAILSLLTKENIGYQILGGGLILGAFFMATDYVTSPITKNGKIIFGIGCGMITFLIRKVGGYPEGVCYSILFMNTLVPLINKYTLPKKFGSKK
ncbi:MAG: RnfABCDGE type electron transport complex subunit D [Candidatus Omnitrophica bacterium]|nr:RnfABCDGE type electron transport complex subunit D [Candidatus Omnitrophota bacterium]MCM8809587.1 RnfABCDGE type electron transport complex subunit D [Candidatus Omnitrophota bacterium]MCM8811332.1 RnfABCDGE type electron transport complex subunit D [Candidatus Omnitrophota bacterium]